MTGDAGPGTMEAIAWTNGTWLGHEPSWRRAGPVDHGGPGERTASSAATNRRAQSRPSLASPL